MTKKVTVSDYNEENSKKIGTKYNVIAEKKDTSLVEVELETGRTHQIRAQFSHIGNPLYGDTKYGSRHSGGMNLASYKLYSILKLTRHIKLPKSQRI